jgi:ketosteroid isomerase-like protein
MIPYRYRVTLACTVGLCFLAIFPVALRSASRADERVPTDSEAIRQLIARYAQSVDDADTTLASQIWMNSPEVSFIHPLGLAHGFEEIKKEIYDQLMGQIFSERKLVPHDIVIHVHGDSAWAEFYWDFNARFRKDGSPVTTHGRETQVYWKTKDGWRLVHVHYSGMPMSDPNRGF